MPKNRAPRIAVFPGLFLLVFEGLIWALSAATGWDVWVAVGLFALIAGTLAAILAVPLILAEDGRHRVIWSVFSVCLSAIGIFFGFILFLVALKAGCNSCFE